MEKTVSVEQYLAQRFPSREEATEDDAAPMSATEEADTVNEENMSEVLKSLVCVFLEHRSWFDNNNNTAG
jgi:hypothetical protein